MISKDHCAPITLPGSQTIFRDRTDAYVRIKLASDGGFRRCGSHGWTPPEGMMDAGESGRLRDVSRMLVRTVRRASIRLPHSFVRQQRVTAWSGPLRREMKRRSEMSILDMRISQHISKSRIKNVALPSYQQSVPRRLSFYFTVN